MKSLLISDLTRIQGFCAIGLLLLATGILYGHTLHAPFYLDDHALFNGTPHLRDLADATGRLFSQRGLTNLSFALNYWFFGWSLPELHLVNILLHFGCALLCWLVLRRLLRETGWSLLGALIFVAHPLQTQAVTYLVQRAALLGTFLFLLAFYSYLRAREVLAAEHHWRSPRYLRWYAAALLAGAAAVLAKENTATLPLLLMVYDRLFPGTAARVRQPFLTYLPFFVVPLLLGIATLANVLVSGDGLVVDSEVVALQHNSPLHYLVTQFTVLWVYVRLLFVPVGQALLHNYPVVAELLTWQNGVALAGLAGLGGLAWWLRLRRPLVTFGIAWFFLALAVESSILPLDPLFEHRLYLPMAGFLLVLLDALPALLGRRSAWVVLLLMLCVFAPLAWQRNGLWNDPVALYEDNLRVAPESERVLEFLGVAYGEAGDFPRAQDLLQRAAAINPRDASVLTNLGVVSVWKGDWPQAVVYFERSLRLAPESEKALFNYAVVLYNLGDKPRALEILRRVATLYPTNAEAQYGLGSLAMEFARRSEVEAARDALRRLGDARAAELDALLSR